MRDVSGGPVNIQEPPKFEGFEQRLLDELKILVAERAVDVVDPVATLNPGRSPFRMPAWRRAGLVGAIALVTGSVAAAVVLAGGSGPGPSGGERIELTAFLNRAAAAARSDQVTPAKPGQVLVERVKAGETGPKTAQKVGCYVLLYDTPATGQGSFPTTSGPCRAGRSDLSPYLDQIAVVSGHHKGFAAMTLKPNDGTHGYPDPAKLPTDPKALLVALNQAARQGNWNIGAINGASIDIWATGLPRSGTVFGLIERLLQAPIRPALRAALFEVTGRLKGITLDRHATDVIGRPGVGIELPLPIDGSPDGLRLEFVLSQKTYRFLGFAMTDSVDGNPSSPAKYGYAVIRSFLVTPKSAKH